jgi:hypothetical protein
MVYSSVHPFNSLYIPVISQQKKRTRKKREINNNQSAEIERLRKGKQFRDKQAIEREIE